MAAPRAAAVSDLPRPSAAVSDLPRPSAAAVPLSEAVAEDACPDERVDVEVDHVGRVAERGFFARDVGQRPGRSHASPPVHSASSVKRFDTDHVRPKVQK